MNFWSYRRMLLDKDLEEAKAKGYMKGMVLDVGGGRKRGEFKEPRDATFIVLDIQRGFHPAVLGDAHNLPFRGSAFDCVKCTELLEHVEDPERAIKEITRVLKPSGTLILSMPFNVGIHADPYDFQRFTDYKLRKMLEKDFEIEINKKHGLYFTVLFYMIKQNILNMKSRVRWLFYWTLPILDVLVKLDNFNFVKNSKFMSSFTIGFFVVAVKR